jgi:hypothetical protein
VNRAPAFDELTPKSARLCVLETRAAAVFSSVEDHAQTQKNRSNNAHQFSGTMAAYQAGQALFPRVSRAVPGKRVAVSAVCLMIILLEYRSVFEATPATFLAIHSRASESEPKSFTCCMRPSGYSAFTCQPLPSMKGFGLNVGLEFVLVMSKTRECFAQLEAEDIGERSRNLNSETTYPTSLVS